MGVDRHLASAASAEGRDEVDHGRQPALLEELGGGLAQAQLHGVVSLSRSFILPRKDSPIRPSYGRAIESLDERSIIGQDDGVGEDGGAASVTSLTLAEIERGQQEGQRRQHGHPVQWMERPKSGLTALLIPTAAPVSTAAASTDTSQLRALLLEEGRRMSGSLILVLESEWWDKAASWSRG